MKIEWSKFRFISRKDCWYIEGTNCICQFDYGEPKLDSLVEQNCGMFSGLTNEIYKGYIGNLPREDEESCAFDEFDIYLNGELVNKLTYSDLIKRLKSIDRDLQINNLL